MITAAMFFGMAILVCVITIGCRVYKGQGVGHSSEMKNLKGQKDVQVIDVARGESDDFDLKAQHFDADGEEVTEVDSKRDKNPDGNAVFVSELAVKTLDKIPMKKAKGMFQVGFWFIKLICFKKNTFRVLTCMFGSSWSWGFSIQFLHFSWS